MRTAVLCTNNLLTHKMLCEPLRAANCNVVLAVNARETLAQCRARQLHLVIVDLDWPSDDSGDARQVAKQVLGACRYMPVIVISGREDLWATAEALGVAAIAEKPVDVPALLRTAEELMAQASHSEGEIREDHFFFRRLPSNSAAFREAIWRRASAPFQHTKQTRDWGLNE